MHSEIRHRSTIAKFIPVAFCTKRVLGGLRPPNTRLAINNSFWNKLLICMLALLPACKLYELNREINCTNPKAACFERDREAPTVVSTTPASQPSVASPAPVATLNTLIVNFSEPMKNADELSNYPNPTVSGGSLSVISVTKINAQSVQLNLTGSVGAGSVVFDLSRLKDLAGNAPSPATVTVLTSSIAAVPEFVTSTPGAYNETNITWTNTTPYAMTYAVKKNGADCSTATAVAGANVAGTVMSNAQVVTNLSYTQITAGATDTVRVCLTPVSLGSATSFTVNVGRDEVAPTLSTLSLTRCQLPYTIAVTCTDNGDRIIYTIDGTVPAFTVTSTGSTVGATASANALAYPTAGGYSLTTHGLVTFRYVCIDKAGHLNTGGVLSATCQSKGVWGSTGAGTYWHANSPAQPYDVWD